MKNILIFTLMLTISFVSYSQKKPKIKGNKMVTDVYKTLDGFNAIEISDNLKVTISQAAGNGYHLMTDENLVDVVNFVVVDSVLKISTTHNITSSKKLEISLTYQNINEIILKDEANLLTATKLYFEELSFYAYDKSKYELDLNISEAKLNFSKNSDGKLLITGGMASLKLDENAYVKGSVALEELEVSINNRADINLDGDVNKLKMNATGSSDIKAKNLKAISAYLNSSNSSDIYIYVGKELNLYAKGKSAIYVYGNPEIKVEGLNDKSKIIKK